MFPTAPANRKCKAVDYLSAALQFPDKFALVFSVKNATCKKGAAGD
jgi:hypothetical protein